MSLVKEILKTVSSYPGGYRVIYDALYGKDGGKMGTSEASVRNTLSRMKKSGLISNKNSAWQITSMGKEILYHHNKAIVAFAHEKPKKSVAKTTIVIFDIPEKKRKYRDWLRHELICFGFELIQKSVWFGPALPKEFITYLNEIKLLQYIRFFQVKDSDLI